jgi:lipopolysaccharide biosynthesis glycosyltransferase
MVGFYLICEKGDLEIKSLLLIKSLKKYLPSTTFEINVLIPCDQVPLLKTTIEYFEKLGCRIKIFSNELYHIGHKSVIPGDKVSNKIYFLDDKEQKYNRLVFLDSDIMLIKPFNPSNLYIDKQFSAKQANRANVKRWEEIYSALGIPYPQELFACGLDGVMIPPYFNSGFISINPTFREELFNVWKDIFLSISTPVFLGEGLFHPFNRDQVSLALAINKLGVEYDILPEIYNYSLKSKTPIEEAVFIHYHDPTEIWAVNKLQNLFWEIYNECDYLKKLVRRSWTWSWVFKSKGTRFFFTNPFFKRITDKVKRVLR